MADILIKGMGIPQNCDECGLAKMESEFHGICTAIRNDVCYVYPDKGKPDWCPLVEVHAHGRLIDADATLEVMNTWDKFGFSHTGAFVREPKTDDFVPYVHYEDMVRCIQNMPTVLEASEEE